MEKGKDSLWLKWAKKTTPSRRVLVLLMIFYFVFLCGAIYMVSLLRGSPEAARESTAGAQIATFEEGCRVYMQRHDGLPPPSLEYLVDPQDGTAPLVEGGRGMLQSPIEGRAYDYDPTRVDKYGNPDPMVTVKLPDGKVLYNPRRLQEK